MVAEVLALLLEGVVHCPGRFSLKLRKYTETGLKIFLKKNQRGRGHFLKK